MLARKKTYIQNCTGSHIKNEKKRASDKAADAVVSRVAFYFLLVAFLGVTGYVLFFSAYLKISTIVIKGNEELNSDEIKNVIESNQQGNILKVIPRDNFLLVSAKNSERSLMNEFRKIKQVTVVKKFPDTLEITLQERKALLILCSGEKCFLIDENGTAYSDANFDSPELTQNHLIKILDKSSQDIQIGDDVMDQAYIRYISALKESLQNIGVIIDGDFWTSSLVADEIDVKISEGGELYFSTQFPLENAVKTLDVILKKELVKTQQADIAYIDLRAENKVFYKLDNSSVAVNTENIEKK